MPGVVRECALADDLRHVSAVQATGALGENAGAELDDEGAAHGVQ